MKPTKRLGTYTHHAMLIRHAGCVWAVAPHYAVRFVDDPEITYADTDIESTPDGFMRLFAGCPPIERRATVTGTNITMFSGQRLFDIGGVHVLADSLAAIESEYGRDLEWCVTVAEEPIYALRDGDVVGFMMGIRPLVMSGGA